MKRFPEGWPVLSANNCEITEQSAVTGGRHQNKGLPIEKLISARESDKGQMEWEAGGDERRGGEGKKDRVQLGSKAVFLSVQTLLLRNLPQVLYLLWSTKLPNVLISAANAAGKQEDRILLSKGTCTVQ